MFVMIFFTGIVAGRADEDSIPSEPQLVDVVYTSQTSARVSWFPPADQSVRVRGYKIGYGTSVPEENEVETDAITLDVELTDLEPNMRYVVQVRAFNNRGLGLPVYKLLEPTEGGGGGEYNNREFAIYMLYATMT